MKVLGLRLEKPMRQLMAFINLFAIATFSLTNYAEWQMRHNIAITIFCSVLCFCITILINICVIKMFIVMKTNRIVNIQNWKNQKELAQKFKNGRLIIPQRPQRIQEFMDRNAENAEVIQYIKELEDEVEKYDRSI